MAPENPQSAIVISLVSEFSMHHFSSVRLTACLQISLFGLPSGDAVGGYGADYLQTRAWNEAQVGQKFVTRELFCALYLYIK